ncbi:MAG: tyrosine--tRNA ligase [Collinsella sp.]
MLSVDEQMRIITSGAAQIVPEADLRKELERGEPLNIKLGVDPTSPDLHLGHAVPLRKMRQFQDLGHNVTLIIGNGTALIGDPSGRRIRTRPQLTSGAESRLTPRAHVKPGHDDALDPEKTTIVHNGDWILSMDLAGLLQVCSKFTVARILERDDFTKRYQSQTPIALHEFLYPVMQAYDSVMIKADVEMGGATSFSSLLARPVEAHGEDGHGAPDVALTVPLLREHRWRS